MSLEMVVGELKGAMKSTNDKIEKLEERVGRIEDKQDKILEVISETKGGWKVLSILAAISATIGATAGKLLPKFWIFLFG